MNQERKQREVATRGEGGRKILYVVLYCTTKFLFEYSFVLRTKQAKQKKDSGGGRPSRQRQGTYIVRRKKKKKKKEEDTRFGQEKSGK